jgi:ankyrin repeat protein
MDSTLLEAIKKSNLAAVKKCILFGCDPTSNNNHALILAASYGNVPIINFLIENGCNPRCKDDSCLLNSATSGNLEAVKLFIKHGCTIDDSRILYRASRCGHFEIVEYLIKLGCDPNKQNTSAFAAAAEFGHLQICKFFADLGYNTSIALLSGSKSNKIEIVKILVKNNSNLQNDLALSTAIANENVDIVKYLIEKGQSTDSLSEKDVNWCALNDCITISTYLDYKIFDVMCGTFYVKQIMDRNHELGRPLTDGLTLGPEVVSDLTDFLCEKEHMKIIKHMLRLDTRINNQLFSSIMLYMRYNNKIMANYIYSYLSLRSKYLALDIRKTIESVTQNSKKNESTSKAITQIENTKNVIDVFEPKFCKELLLRRFVRKNNFMKALLRPTGLIIQLTFI